MKSRCEGSGDRIGGETRAEQMAVMKRGRRLELAEEMTVTKRQGGRWRTEDGEGGEGNLGKRGVKERRERSEMQETERTVGKRTQSQPSVTSASAPLVLGFLRGERRPVSKFGSRIGMSKASSPYWRTAAAFFSSSNSFNALFHGEVPRPRPPRSLEPL